MKNDAGEGQFLILILAFMIYMIITSMMNIAELWIVPMFLFTIYGISALVVGLIKDIMWMRYRERRDKYGISSKHKTNP